MDITLIEGTQLPVRLKVFLDQTITNTVISDLSQYDINIMRSIWFRAIVTLIGEDAHAINCQSSFDIRTTKCRFYRSRFVQERLN